MIKIEVTQEDIDKATDKLNHNPDSYISTWCPIALAGKRALNDDTFKWGFNMGYSGHSSNIVVYNTTDDDCMRAVNFVCAFDKGRKVSPTTIHIVKMLNQES